MSSYADHQRMVTLEQRVATLEVRAAEAERVAAELQAEVARLKERSIPHGGLPDVGLDQSGMHDPPSPYEQWREKKAARKAAD